MSRQNFEVVSDSKHLNYFIAAPQYSMYILSTLSATLSLAILNQSEAFLEKCPASYTHLSGVLVFFDTYTLELVFPIEINTQ